MYLPAFRHGTLRRASLASAAALLCLASSPGIGLSAVPGRSTETARSPSGGASKSDSAGALITLDFREVDIDNVLKFFSMATGLTLVKDAGLTGPVTILMPRPVSLDQGFKILEAVLNTKGYTLQREEMLLRVTATRSFGAGPRGGAVRGGFSGGPGGGFGPGGDRGTLVSVFRLKVGSARQIAQIINDLFRTTTLGGRGAAGPFGGPGGLRNAAGLPGGGGFPGGGFPGGGFPGAGFPGGGFPGGGPVTAGPDGQVIAPISPPAPASDAASSAAGSAAAVRASSDDYTNSVIVAAPPPMLSQIQTLIEQLDQKVPLDIQTRIFRLENSDATEMASVVSSILASIKPGNSTGSGGGAQGVPFEQRIRFAGGAGGQSASAAQVVPDTRTNALIITTSAEDMSLLEGIIQDLDSPVRAKPNVFVLRLENARATDVSNLLNQAFGNTNRTNGTSSTTGNTNSFFGANGSSNRSGNQGFGGGNGGGFGGAGGFGGGRGPGG